MFTHKQIWSAIDQLAKRQNLSPSGLAKKAGLDATTFNKSKRFTRDMQPRWPSTQIISKILEVEGISLDTFVRMLQKG